MIKNKSFTKILLWSLIPIITGIIFSSFVVKAFKDTDYVSSIETERRENPIVGYFKKIKSIAGKAQNSATGIISNIDFQKIIYPPKATYHLKDQNLLPKVGASSYVVADVDTGEIIVEKNSEEIYAIASVTKLMTALVSLEELDQNETTKVSVKATNTLGTSGMLKQGEKIKISDLLYPLLLVSSNDASEALAEHEGRSSFMQKMNEKAKEIGMQKTNYDDPSGLSGDNYSTAKDLLALTYYLFNKHKTVFNITTLDKYSLGGRTWSNANYRFSRRDDYLGGKTGYTDKAKRTGVSIFSVPFEDYDNRNIAIILLKTDNRTADINNILDYLSKNVYFAYEEQIGSKSSSVKLGFVGDIMLDRGVKTSVYKNFDGKYLKIFEQAKELQRPDIMFGNLEGPISDKGKNVGSKYSFRFEPVVAEVLKDAGFDILSFANNHVGDWSNQAFRDTLGHLSENNILFTGAGENYDKAKKPTIIERNGIRIGYLGFSDVGPDWMKATNETEGILLLSDKNLETIVKEAKESVDVLVVSIHWGDEYKPFNKRQETFAKKIIDSGADIIAGHHPHVIQEVKEYKDGLIIYSLGNFVFDQYFSPETMEGLYAEVEITKDGIKDYKKTVFEINEKYQPVLDIISNSLLSFETGLCPIGNNEQDLILFNSNNQNSVEDYIPEGLVEINKHLKTKDGRVVCLIEEAARKLDEMEEAAKKEGLDLVITSGFRSYDTQDVLHNQSYSSTNPEGENDSIAKPGHSEHQLGTTVDITTKEINEASASTAFDQTKVFKWLSENASNYGFVMTYPKDIETGYIYEPWHWRYLGEAEAKEIKSKNIPVQEYLESL